MIDDVLKVVFRIAVEMIAEAGATSLSEKYIQVDWRKLPESRRKEILKRNRWRDVGTKLMFVAGIGSAFVVWECFGFAANDWRPVAFGFGLGVMLSAIFWDLSFRGLFVNEHTLADRAALESRAGSRRLQFALLLICVAIFVVGSLGIARLI